MFDTFEIETEPGVSDGLSFDAGGVTLTPLPNATSSVRRRCVREACAKAQGGVCAYCTLPLPTRLDGKSAAFDLDRVRSNVNADTLDGYYVGDLVAACRDCNSDHPYREWLRVRGYWTADAVLAQAERNARAIWSAIRTD